jgi:hypothetical protein
LIPAEVKLVWFFETLKVVAANGSQHIVKTPETISSRGKDSIRKIKSDFWNYFRCKFRKHSGNGIWDLPGN